MTRRFSQKPHRSFQELPPAKRAWIKIYLKRGQRAKAEALAQQFKIPLEEPAELSDP